TNDDATLIAKAVAGDKGAVRALYDRHRLAVVRLAQGFAELDPDEVNDIVQETFVRAFRALSRLRERERFAPWLLTITRNRCFSHLAKRQLISRTLEELGREVGTGAEPEVASAFRNAAELEAVRELIASLPEG